MINYIQFTVPDGGTILVEIEEPTTHSPNVGRVGVGEVAEKMIMKAQNTFIEALHIIGSNARAFINEVRGLADSPDEVEVTFGLKALGELGNFAIAKANAEANYTVRLTWKLHETLQSQNDKELNK